MEEYIFICDGKKKGYLTTRLWCIDPKTCTKGFLIFGYVFVPRYAHIDYFRCPKFNDLAKFKGPCWFFLLNYEKS